MRYPYEFAQNTNVRVALWLLHRCSWHLLEKSLRSVRNEPVNKCAILVAHDRILNGEVEFRGLPSFCGEVK